MKRENTQFYLVDLQILPEAIKKTIQAKELLKQGQAETIHEAVLKTGLSRSVYYKYKDHVAPAFETDEENVITIFLIMMNDMAVLTRILKRMTREKCSILTVNRSMPARRMAAVTISFSVSEMQSDPEELVQFIKNLKGVKRAEVIGEEQIYEKN